MGIRSDIVRTAYWLAGEDKTITFEVTEADGVTRQDMNGWGLEFALTVNEDSSDVLVTKVSGAGIFVWSSVGDSVFDRATVTVASADTSDLTPGSYWYVFSRTDFGNRDALALGSAYLGPGIT